MSEKEQQPPKAKYEPHQLGEAFGITVEVTAKPEIQTVGIHKAVGEYHVRLQNDEVGNQEMQSALEGAEVIIVEFDSASSGYESSTEFKRFMSMAQDAGKDKELIIMDLVRPSGFQTWRRAGINITEKNYQALVALECAQLPVMATIGHEGKEINQDEVTNEIALALIKKIPEIEPASAKKLAEGAKNTVMISSALGGGEIFKHIKKYFDVDSFAREVVYQQIIAERVNKADSKKIVVTVGRAHLKAAADALTGKFGKRKVKDAVLEQFEDTYDMIMMFTHS